MMTMRICGDGKRMRMLLVLMAAWSLAPIALSSAQAVSVTDAIKVPKTADGSEVMVKPFPQSGYGKHYAFPSIKDWNSLRIRLERTSCFGSCPDYSVEIRGDSTVRYNGRHCVRVLGERFSRLSKEQVQALLAAFQKADFFSLLDHYGQGIVDAPGMSLSLQYDKWGKYVLDNALTTGIPEPAASLPDMIDRAVGVERWIGNSERFCRLP